MTHRRIRPFNTRDTYPEQRLDNDLCQAVVAGNIVFIRGQVGQDLDTSESVGHGDAAAQAERAMENIAQLLSEAGAQLEDICRVTVYLIDIRYREEVYRVIGRHLKGVFPVSTGVVVTALARPEWLVEVEATAVIPADPGDGHVTFSLLGIDAATGQIGGVITSSSPAVAARCIAARAAVGAAASQNITDPRLGPRLLDLLTTGRSPQEAIDEIVATEPDVGYRQLAVVDRQGHTAAYSGPQTLGRHACAQGSGAVAAGNLLADTAVPSHMVEAFAASADAPLGDRLVTALRAGLAAGGEEGPVRSAGLLIVDAVAWPVTDLRVDWADDPIADLAALWQLWKPQSDGYVQRALDPGAAPSFGVPGDE